MSPPLSAGLTRVNKLTSATFSLTPFVFHGPVLFFPLFPFSMRTQQVRLTSWATQSASPKVFRGRSLAPRVPFSYSFFPHPPEKFLELCAIADIPPTFCIEGRSTPMQHRNVVLFGFFWRLYFLALSSLGLLLSLPPSLTFSSDYIVLLFGRECPPSFFFIPFFVLNSFIFFFSRECARRVL